MKLSCTEKTVLAIIAVIGFLGPNGVFVYYSLFQRPVLEEFFSNPVGVALLAEAFILMFLLAWLISRLTGRGGVFFIIASLIGSLSFSVPLFVLRLNKHNSALCQTKTN